LFHSVKLSSKKWVITEQNLKKLKVSYYKPLNKVTEKTLKHSIYKNISSNVAGFVLLVNTRYKTTNLKLQHLVKSLKSSFTLVSIKLNNKIYSTSQVKGLNDLSYEKSAFNLHKLLNKHLKTSYILTNKRDSSK